MLGETWENTQKLGEVKDSDEPLKRDLLGDGRGGEIRTRDLLNPIQAR